MPAVHQFGGNWTEEKLRRLKKYLSAYLQIFTKNPYAQRYKTHYVDAFAGTGSRTGHNLGNDTLSLFNVEDTQDIEEFYSGSARIALDIEPSFDHYLFIDRNPEHVEELKSLAAQYSQISDRITIREGDANDLLQEWCAETDWTKNRAVVFLDPYGMSVRWETVERLAETQAVDLWILLPVGQAINRLLTRKGLPEEPWAEKLTSFFGTEDWKEEFYQPSQQPSLFGEFNEIAMASHSKIEWTEVTWNPVTGCDKVSQGCKFCYAERMAKRLKAMGVARYDNSFEVTLHNDLVTKPLSWMKPRIIFVNSMSDLFHEHVPLDFIQRVFDTMLRCPQHIFQILTKRSARLQHVAGNLPWPSNVWIGVSVENEDVLHRVYDLEHVPAEVRFLSCEPLLGPLDSLPLTNIDWVIVGGESGPGARPMEEEWATSILLQCRKNDVPFFFKQWGGTRKDLTGRMLHGRFYDEFPHQWRFVGA